MMSSFAFGHNRNTNTSTAISVLGQSVTSQVYEATNEFYKDGMSENDFINTAVSGVDKEMVELVRPYLSKLYSYHVQKLTVRQVSDMAVSKEFLQTYSSLSSYVKSHDTVNATTSRIKWLHWLRLLIDLIDDNL